MEISQFSLGLPTILRKVLEQFSTPRLLELSLVSKQWNYEARSIMKARGNVTVKIWSLEVDCEIGRRNFVAFASILEKMCVVPFSGIHFSLHHCRDCLSISNPPLESPYKVILEQIPWKHFSVRFNVDWEHCKDCPALVFVKKVLEDYASVLEELTLVFGHDKFLQPIFQDRSLPRLKSLTIESSKLPLCARHCVPSAFIKTLVSRAPNLQELHVDLGVDLTVNVLEGSSAVLVPAYTLRPFVKPVCESLIGSIRTSSLDFCIRTNQTVPGFLKRFMPKLLEACRSKLEALYMDFIFAVPLLCYGICLKNVTTLVIYMNCPALEQVQPSILNLTRGSDFTRIFPKVTRVTIFDTDDRDFSSDVVSAFVEQGNAVLSTALSDRATNIQILDLVRVESIRSSTLPLLAQLFPDVKTVFVDQTPECSFANLRKHFQSLEMMFKM